MPRRRGVTGATERLVCHGPPALSELELLAVVLGSVRGHTAAQRAQRVLHSTGGSIGGLARMDPGQLAALEGVGGAGANRIVAALELGRRVVSSDGRDRTPVAGPKDVWRHMAARVGELAHEEFHVLLLNAQNVPICSRQVTRGILDASLVHPREVFRDAIVSRAASLVLVHNHPSGDPEPSREDVLVTRRLVRAGDELGIPVVDHVIIAGGSFVSLASRHLLRTGPEEDGVAWHVRDPLRGSCH
ncbi:MAG: RadC family protein [Longimicrobiales bacterium]